MRFLNKVDHILSMVEKSLVVLLFSALVVLITFNIISRNLFDSSFQKILEFSPALVLWLALIGASLGLKTRRHIKLELLLRFCPEKIRLTALTAVSIFGMIVMLILCVASMEFVKNEMALFGTAGRVSLIFPLFFTTAFFRYFVTMLNGFGDRTIASNPPLSESGPDEMEQP